MTPEQLADSFGHFLRACRQRVLGVGAEQYSEGEKQKFETMPLPELVAWAREEAQDLGVYAAMVDIRLQRLEAVVKRLPPL
ncbi:MULTISPECIES: hypothetical protein [Streptomyces]|uniref:hypothetical protein n=1 Tax=Streptomyces TaxID=1883 RepID=UPI002443417C|nr:hypothetical protein [Streptomyces sp. DH10]MDG9711132.1 hypothetical protein [Streptomyces sp. DH10]